MENLNSYYDPRQDDDPTEEERLEAIATFKASMIMIGCVIGIIGATMFIRYIINNL